MVCKHCDQSSLPRGTLMHVTKDGCCAYCDRPIVQGIENPTNSKWDQYFFELCKTIATKSPCLSRQIGALLVRDNSIVSTGYNGPPRGIPHCGQDRCIQDDYLLRLAKESGISTCADIWFNACPRKCLGYVSGTHMELCPAQHAEENAVSNAARNGVSVLGCTLYMNAPIPCKNCFGTLINAGIIEIVIPEAKAYDKYTQYLIDNSTIKIREFQLHKEPPYAKS
jgi:dCMP deaminase